MRVDVYTQADRDAEAWQAWAKAGLLMIATLIASVMHPVLGIVVFVGGLYCLSM